MPAPALPLPFPATLAAFGTVDWFILGGYLGLMLAIGLVAAWRESRHKSNAEDFFLGGRSMPTWVLAISIVGSSLSVATFVGVPDRSYGGDVTYLVLYVGNFIAAFVVGFVFVPRLYRAGTVTIYGYLAQRFGETARVAVSLTFLFGRMLASGARLMLAAVPLCMLVRNAPASEITKEQMVMAILVIGFVGTFYTVFGGIKAVVWVDALQFALVVGAAVLSIGLLLHRIPLPIGQLWRVLADADKLRVVDLSTDPTKPFTLWTALTGGMLVSMAAFGVDHDLAQRFLIARSPARGALSVIASQFVGIVVVAMFLVIGLLLYVYYKRPDIMGWSPPYPPPSTEQATAAYQLFMMKELPPVASGLAMAGLFAVARGSLDSAINALASSLVADIYLPLRRARGRSADADKPMDAPKIAVAAVGAVLVGFAILCVYVYDPKQPFLDFALNVLNFAFSGMLAVFLTALLTRRGNSATVVAALVTGIVVVTLTQDAPLQWITSRLFGRPTRIAFTWAMPVATGLAFLVCVAGATKRREG
jgi:SSS family transporter